MSSFVVRPSPIMLSIGLSLGCAGPTTTEDTGPTTDEEAGPMLDEDVSGLWNMVLWGDRTYPEISVGMSEFTGEVCTFARAVDLELDGDSAIFIRRNSVDCPTDANDSDESTESITDLDIYSPTSFVFGSESSRFSCSYLGDDRIECDNHTDEDTLVVDYRRPACATNDDCPAGQTCAWRQCATPS